MKIFPVFLMSFLSLGISAQVGFNIPDTICLDEEMIIENTSRDADTYYWNFCSGNLIHNPEGNNLANPGTLDKPAFVDFANDGGHYYSFISNHNNGTLVRNDYGNSFLNQPNSVNLGTFGGNLPRNAEGIQVVQDNQGNWYVFLAGGQRSDSRIVKLDFGNSLSNTPTATNLGNPGDFLDYPVDLYILYETGNWIGFTVNANTSTLTKIDFGSSLNHVPVIENLGDLGYLNQPRGIIPLFDSGEWRMFITNSASDEIIRLDFGSSLYNNPMAHSIGDNSVLEDPFDLTLIRDCENTYGFVLNEYNDIVRMVFNNGLDNPPEFTSLGETGGLFNPHGISDVFRVGDTLYAFVANIGNSTLTRLYFPGCSNATPASSFDRNPSPVRYNAPGIYNVNLIIDEGQPDQESFCKNVVVLDSADLFLGNDTLITAGTSVVLQPDSAFSSYEWSTGSVEPAITTDKAGIYTLTVTNQYGCKATDQIEVIVDIGIPNFFTPNGDGFNDLWEIPFLKSNPQTVIEIFDRFGNLLLRYKAGEGEWNGMAGGHEMSEGTYWYIIDVPGNNKPYKGSVTIKR